MALYFPKQDDIRLRNSPLAEVICQVRFPPILTITASQPIEFQERIRARFPILGYQQGLFLRVLQPGAAPQAEPQPPSYKFSTPDGQTSISLSTDFYALSTSRYSHWAAFKEDLLLAASAVVDIYRPVYASRIGLRFINRLSPANTQMADFGSRLQLLQPELTALMRSAVWDPPQENLNQVILSDDGARLAMRALYTEENAEHIFVLDFDYFEEGQLGLDDLIQRTDRYHDIIYRAFRWSLRDGAINVFEPIA